MFYNNTGADYPGSHAVSYYDMDLNGYFTDLELVKCFMNTGVLVSFKVILKHKSKFIMSVTF